MVPCVDGSQQPSVLCGQCCQLLAGFVGRCRAGADVVQIDGRDVVLPKGRADDVVEGDVVDEVGERFLVVPISAGDCGNAYNVVSGAL